jgi:methylphosphotriester-DNA--protein-cysteine methyltransferase
MTAAAPDPLLSRWVRGYVGLTSELTVTAERHLPSGEAALVLNSGEPYHVIGPREALRVTWAAVMGVHTAPFRTLGDGRKSVILVRLTPAAVQRLLGVPMASLTNRWADLEALDADLARALAAGVDEARCSSERFAAVDAVLGRRLAAAKSTPVVAAWEQIGRSGGVVRVGELARNVGVSHRRLLGGFRREVGVGPKTAARIARFNRVLADMGRIRMAPGAREAVAHGYFDQAHMLAEFRAFAHATPTAVMRSAAAFTLRA